MGQSARPLAIVTGASSGIGLELAKLCAENGFDLLIAADEPEIEEAARMLRGLGAAVEAHQLDLARLEGIDARYDAIHGRPVAALLANAGLGLGGGFLDQPFKSELRIVETNIIGTIYLVHKVARDMRAAGAGRILFTGSIAGYIPGAFAAVYDASKAFINSFSYALRNELKDSGVTVSCLMPGATDTEFFERADMMDTKVGQDDDKDDPADVAKTGFEAMMRGEASVVHGMHNKLQVAAAKVMPQTATAEQHRGMAEPGSAKN